MGRGRRGVGLMGKEVRSLRGWLGASGNEGKGEGGGRGRVKPCMSCWVLSGVTEGIGCL